MKKTAAVAALLASAAPHAAAAPGNLPPPTVLSSGQKVVLTDHLTPERPTVFVFTRPGSSLERSFVEEIRRDAGEGAGFAVIHLKTGSEPVAQQYEVRETPTAIVYDRRGRMTARSSDAGEIKAAIKKAAGVMRIDWVEEGDPRMEEVVRLLGGRREIPGILHTMTLQPRYMAYINDLSRIAHFSNGFLPRRMKEMIATYVSALNRCKY
jgi:hypothetical protein